MKKYCFVFLVTVLSSCQWKTDWQKKQILKKEEAVMNDAKVGKIDSVKLNELLKAYEDFAEAHPGDTTAASFLFKAADFYRYMHQPLKSIGVYEKIYNNFPNYDKRPIALFLQGFIFETDLQNYSAALTKYHEFLKNYPDHFLAKDVKLSLQTLGKTPEELVEEFQKKNSVNN